MQNALAAGILVSLACGLIGTFVVVNRMVFISGGIGLGYFFRSYKGGFRRIPAES